MSKRIILLAVAVLGLFVVIKLVQAQGHSPPPNTLLEVVQAWDLVGFQRDEKTNLYSFQVLSADLTKASEDYYAKESENGKEQLKLLQERAQLANHRELVDREALRAIDEKLKAFARPSGDYRVGHITSRGTDFIGVTELNRRTETLIPAHMIFRVTRERE